MRLRIDCNELSLNSMATSRGPCVSRSSVLSVTQLVQVCLYWETTIPKLIQSAPHSDPLIFEFKSYAC